MFNRKQSWDRKIRYLPEIRNEMYSFMIDMIRCIDEDVPISLCKEERRMWEEVGLEVKECKCNCMV